MDRLMVDREKTEMLPAEPFLEWIRAQVKKHDGSVDEVAGILQLSPRRVRQFMDGYYSSGAAEGRFPLDQISIDVVDSCLMLEGSLMLCDLYPSLYSFAA